MTIRHYEVASKICTLVIVAALGCAFGIFVQNADSYNAGFDAGVDAVMDHPKAFERVSTHWRDTSIKETPYMDAKR